MKIIGNRDLLETFKLVAPRKIAVAYLGIDFEQYLDVETDRGRKTEIVVSPTIGSNPRAIRRLVSYLGWDRVHFLDRLHAKIYIGRNRAIVSSANLTANGLEITGLREIGILIEDAAGLRRLAHEYEEILGEARKQYPSTKQKQSALARLEAKGKKLFKRGGLVVRPKPVAFRKYDPVVHGRFKLSWWDEYADFSKERAAKVTGLSKTEVKKAAKDYVFLTRKDDVAEGDWLLVWKSIGDGRVGVVHWMYVDKIWKKCSGDADYPDLAVELTKKYRPVLQAGRRPVEPFVIDKAFKRTFSAVIMLPKFAAFQPPKSEDDIWYMNNSAELFRELIRELRK